MERLAAVRPRTFVAGVIVTLVLGALVFGIWPRPQAEEHAGGPVLDTRFASAGTDAAAYIDDLGDEGRRLYGIMLTGDMLWTIVHGLTVAAGIAIGVSRSGISDRLRVLAVLPLVSMVLDIVENSSFLAAIAAHPGDPPVPTGIMNAVTATKFTILGISYVVLAVALIAWAAARRRPAT